MSAPDSAYASADHIANRVAGVLDPIYQALDQLAEALLTVLPPAALAGEPGSVSERQLGSLERWLVPHLHGHPALAGLGFVATPGLVAGHERYLYWWQRVGAGQPSRLRLNFDAESVDVYDYLQMEWFQGARAGAPRTAFGPYVDYTGAGAYVVTASVPVTYRGEFLGVAGADITLAALEPRLLAIVADARPGTVVLNAERRVLAANTPRFVVGTRVEDSPLVPAPVGVPRGAGWQVLTLP